MPSLLVLTLSSSCPWGKNTLSPVTACIGAHYITKGYYDFRFLKELCNNRLQAGIFVFIKDEKILAIV